MQDEKEKVEKDTRVDPASGINKNHIQFTANKKLTSIKVNKAILLMTCRQSYTPVEALFSKTVIVIRRGRYKQINWDGLY